MHKNHFSLEPLRKLAQIQPFIMNATELSWSKGHSDVIKGNTVRGRKGLNGL
jgi:hypothetical protein